MSHFDAMDDRDYLATTNIVDFLSLQDSHPNDSQRSKRLRNEATVALLESAADTPQVYKVRSISGDLMHWNLSVMPSEYSLYFGGNFDISLDFPDTYPHIPPKATFHTKIFHPNIGIDGVVGMPEFVDGWTPALMSDRIIRTIIANLDTPFIEVDDYVCNTEAADMAMSDREKYEQTVAEWLVQYALPPSDLAHDWPVGDDPTPSLNSVPSANTSNTRQEDSSLDDWVIL